MNIGYELKKKKVDHIRPGTPCNIKEKESVRRGSKFNKKIHGKKGQLIK